MGSLIRYTLQIIRVLATAQLKIAIKLHDFPKYKYRQKSSNCDLCVSHCFDQELITGATTALWRRTRRWQVAKGLTQDLFNLPWMLRHRFFRYFVFQKCPQKDWTCTNNKTRHFHVWGIPRTCKRNGENIAHPTFQFFGTGQTFGIEVHQKGPKDHVQNTTHSVAINASRVHHFGTDEHMTCDAWRGQNLAQSVPATCKITCHLFFTQSMPWPPTFHSDTQKPFAYLRQCLTSATGTSKTNIGSNHMSKNHVKTEYLATLTSFSTKTKKTQHETNSLEMFGGNPKLSTQINRINMKYLVRPKILPIHRPPAAEDASW